MFRIERKLVKLVGSNDNQSGTDENYEVGAEGVFPDAATSAEAMVNEYMSAAEVQMNEKAEEILAAARAEAEQIAIAAREEAKEERKRGFEQGFEEGSAEGKRSSDEALSRVLDELYCERERAYKSMEDEVVNLALEIVKKIIHPTEDELGTIFTSLIKNALRQISTESKIVIRVSTADYERFFASGAVTIELDSGATVTAAVINDMSLGDGDCVIDTDDFTVNAGIDSQLQLVKLAFENVDIHEPD